MASQITSLTVVYSTVYSDADQRKHQSSASLAFVWGIHRDRWIPRTKGQLRGKCFHLMTSSWYRIESCPTLQLRLATHWNVIIRRGIYSLFTTLNCITLIKRVLSGFFVLFFMINFPYCDKCFVSHSNRKDYFFVLSQLYYSDVKWASNHSNSPASRLFIHQFVHAYIKRKHQGTASLALCEMNPLAIGGFSS